MSADSIDKSEKFITASSTTKVPVVLGTKHQAGSVLGVNLYPRNLIQMLNSFFFSIWHFKVQMMNWLIKKIINRLIEDRYHWLQISN